jgi:hypothetical protein
MTEAITPAMAEGLAAWKRRMMLRGIAITVAGALLFLLGVVVIRDRPTLGYTVGAVGILGLSFGVLTMKFAAWGPFPDRFLPPHLRSTAEDPEGKF